MREIKFRGKCQQGYDYSNGDGWVYGSLLQNGCSMAIVRTEDIDLNPKTDDGYSSIDDFGCIPIIPESVSKMLHKSCEGIEHYEGNIYTHEAYEGDIILLVYDYTLLSVVGQIYSQGANESNIALSSWEIDNRCTLIGNLDDNPELLKSKEE